MASKRFFYKVYNKSGSFLATWADATEPRFSWQINGGYSDMDIKVVRPITDFGEGNDVNVFNRVECYINDNEAVYDAKKIYSGWIADYTPIITENRQEYINVHLMPFTTELTDNQWVTSQSSTFSFTDYDPANMVRNMLDNKFRTVGGEIGSSSAIAGGLTLTGRQLSYTFSAQTYRDAIDKAREISPAGTYWLVDSNNQVNFLPKSTSTIHTFKVGAEIAAMEVTKDAKRVKNAAIGLFGISTDSGSKLYLSYGSESGGYDGSKVLWGKRTQYFFDERVTQLSTAKNMFLNYLDYYNAPLVQAKLVIADSNGETSTGYDIESIQPGQTAVIRDPFRYEIIQPLGNYTLDQTPVDAPIQMLELQPMQIMSVDYTLDSATVTLASAQPYNEQSVYDQERKMREYITSFAPNGIQEV